MTAESSLQQRFGLTVTPENVLGIRAVVLQEAQDLYEFLRNEREQVILVPLGHDPVSQDMADAFNPVTEQLIAQAAQHIDSLKALGQELAATARDYGHTEADISTSFGPHSPHSTVSQIPPVLLETAGMGARATPPSGQSLAELMTRGRV